MLVKEINDAKNLYRRSVLQAIYSLCCKEIKVSIPILQRAEQIRDTSNIKYKDSIHLACAEIAGADALLTIDRKFLNNCGRIKSTQK